MPTRLTANTCRRYVQKTVRAGAPRHLKVAIVAVRPSSQARTPLAMPSPPTSKAVSPTRVRYMVKLSMNRFAPGLAWDSVRTRQPAVGCASRAAATKAAGLVSPGRATR